MNRTTHTVSWNGNALPHHFAGAGKVITVRPRTSDHFAASGKKVPHSIF